MLIYSLFVMLCFCDNPHLKAANMSANILAHNEHATVEMPVIRAKLQGPVHVLLNLLYQNWQNSPRGHM